MVAENQNQAPINGRREGGITMFCDAAVATSNDRPRSGSVQSVERALTLLEALGECVDGHRLTDLAQATGLSPSTVHRLLVTLEKRRFVQFDQSEGRWHVGKQAFSVGASFVRQRNFVASAVPFLRNLRDQTRETANLGVVDDGMVVVLLQSESREIVRAITRVGGRVPLTGSGMGKAILATYGNSDIRALLGPREDGPVAERRCRLAPRLPLDLERAKAVGYAIDDEEYIKGLRCVASVVYNDQADPLCAISVSGLAGRMRKSRLDVLGRLVNRTARDLTLALGGQLPRHLQPA
jgi:IclR family transcriptional regulator, acetate operon repressor